MPRGSRPSTAACISLGARNASEIVILTCRMLHCSRAAICSTVTVPATISSSQRRPVPLSTLSRWITAYKPFTSYAGLRARGLALFPARKTLMRVKLYHRQVYEFAYHRPKLALLTRSGDLADQSGTSPNPASDKLTSNTSTSIPGDDIIHTRSRRQPRFAPLASFLERVPDQCPHALFRASARASQAAAVRRSRKLQAEALRSSDDHQRLVGTLTVHGD